MWQAFVNIWIYCPSQRQYSIYKYNNLPYRDWNVDWTLDSKMDSVFRLEFWSPGVKGHIHINQQQSLCIVSFVGCRICYQSLVTIIILMGISGPGPVPNSTYCVPNTAHYLHIVCTSCMLTNIDVHLTIFGVTLWVLSLHWYWRTVIHVNQPARFSETTMTVLSCYCLKNGRLVLVSYPERGLGMRPDWYQSHYICSIQMMSSWHQVTSKFCCWVI